MTTPTQPLSFAVLLGSVRTQRMGDRAATLLVNALQARGHEAHLVDPLSLQLPLLDRMYKEYPAGSAPAALEQLATLYRRVDGFVIVSAEYNHSVPPALSNLLDHFLEEYFWRPSGIVCYSAGPFGGVRAAVQLRAMLAELGMPAIPSECAIARIGAALDAQGMAQNEHLTHTLERFLHELCWYARALRRERAIGTPR
jgi:NAD(P)H-dependent FMN reductase